MIIATKVIASAGLNYHQEGNPFESFNLDADDGSWSVEEFSLPNVPNDLHIYGSCMVAIDEHRLLVAGGASLEDGATAGGHLVQLFDRRSAVWERLEPVTQYFKAVKKMSEIWGRLHFVLLSISDTAF